VKVVLTGSEGFIGQELIRQCRATDIDVITIDSVAASRPNHHVTDVCSPELREYLPGDADAVIHLAAVSRDRDCARDPLTALKVNVGGAWNVLECARSNGIPQLIFASSEWVYGDVGGQRAQVEETPIDVNRLSAEYALSKLFAERLLHSSWSKNQAAAVTILRFAIVYGPRPAPWSAVEQLFHQVRNERVVEVGSLNTARRFIHVSDIARGVLSTLGISAYEIFNLSGSRLVTLAEIIEESSNLLGRRPRIVETGRSPVTVRNPTNEKARRALGWKPQIDLREGLASLLSQAQVSVQAGLRK
jgi:UDP-glucose 4-epimerase